MIRESNSRHSPLAQATVRWGHCLTLVTVSLALAYLIAAFTFIIRWMHFWIRGPYYQSYLSIFLTMQAIFLLWWLCRHRAGPLSFLSTLIYSMASGYAAGLFAVVLYPLFETDGGQHTLMALQIPTIEAAIALFWFPVRMLTWLFGAITGGVLIFLSRRWRQQTTERAIAYF